jgi:ribosomal silencing factor RsfS
MVLVTVFSRPQLNAVLGKLEHAASIARGRGSFEPVNGRSAWEVLDLGDVVVQIQSADVRKYYGLEDIYMRSEEVPLPFKDEEAAAAERSGAGSALEWTTSMR